MSILGGVLAVVVAAYLAAVNLTCDARRLGDETMTDYYRRRALGAAIVAGCAVGVGIFVLRDDAPYLFAGLTGRALPIVIVSAVCGVVSLVLVWRREQRWARWLAYAAVAAVVVAWGVAQSPYLLPETVTVVDAAAPAGTLTALLVAAAAVLLLVVPFLGLLFVLDQRDLLPEEGVADGP